MIGSHGSLDCKVVTNQEGKTSPLHALGVAKRGGENPVAAIKSEWIRGTSWFAQDIAAASAAVRTWAPGRLTGATGVMAGDQDSSGRSGTTFPAKNRDATSNDQTRG